MFPTTSSMYGSKIGTHDTCRAHALIRRPFAPNARPHATKLCGRVASSVSQPVSSKVNHTWEWQGHKINYSVRFIPYSCRSQHCRLGPSNFPNAATTRSLAGFRLWRASDFGARFRSKRSSFSTHDSCPRSELQGMRMSVPVFVMSRVFQYSVLASIPHSYAAQDPATLNRRL